MAVGFTVAAPQKGLIATDQRQEPVPCQTAAPTYLAIARMVEHTAESVKLLLPPRQSRGISSRISPALSPLIDESAGAIPSFGRATASSENILSGYFAGLGMKNARTEIGQTDPLLLLSAVLISDVAPASSRQWAAKMAALRWN